MNEKYIQFLHLLEKMTNEWEHARKKRREYAPGMFLSRSERDILDEVGRCPGIGVKSIADNKGITEGAVSQMVKLLAGRGLLRKAPSPVSEARICVYLTEEGEKSYRISEQHHSASFSEWKKILERLNDSEIASLTRLMLDVREKIERI